MRVFFGIGVCALLLAASGCSANSPRGAAAERASAPGAPAARSCAAPWRGGWQKFANRTRAAVYCPGWVPQPIDAQIGGQWNNIDSVSGDRSYLLGFVWQETGNGSGEVHVNFRGYPGRTAIPRCPVSDRGKRHLVPCFSDARGHVRANGIDATVYTVNQGADTWHVLYAWRRGGSLYTVSEHVAPPKTYARVRADLDRMLRGLVLIRPKS